MLMFSTTQLAKTMPSSPADNAIMTIGEVADYLKVTERTIYRLAGAKLFPAFKVGGSWRFSNSVDRNAPMAAFFALDAGKMYVLSIWSFNGSTISGMVIMLKASRERSWSR